MFSVYGRLPGREQSTIIQWDDGTLSGDREACDMLRAYARAMEGQNVGPMEGPYTWHNHLADGISAVTLIVDLFEADATWLGDVPHRTAPPVNPVPLERKGR